MWKERLLFLCELLFQPSCFIGNNETWENVSRITELSSMFCCSTVNNTSSVFKSIKRWRSQMLSSLCCRVEGVLMMISLFQLTWHKSSGKVTLPQAGGERRGGYKKMVEGKRGVYNILFLTLCVSVCKGWGPPLPAPTQPPNHFYCDKALIYGELPRADVSPKCLFFLI